MKYKYKPKTKEELIKAIKKEIYKIQGTKSNPNWKADLNCIDTSLIIDMSCLFLRKNSLNDFDGNISNWNVSSVEDMKGMFAYSKFNQDISKWNVSNVETIYLMFFSSKFNKDIGNWNEFLALSTYLNNISADPDSIVLPDEIIYERTAKRAFKLYPEFALVNKTVRKHADKKTLKELIKKYLNIEISDKTTDKAIIKYTSDITKVKSLEKKIEWAYKNVKDEEERKRIITLFVLIPYLKEKRREKK